MDRRVGQRLCRPARYEKALKHGYGRVVRFPHGPQVPYQDVGKEKEWW